MEALVNDRIEVLTDERTRHAKRALSQPPER